MNDKGKEFIDFPDRPKLIDFLNNQNFDIVDLHHNIGLSDLAKKSLELFGYQVSFHIVEEFDKLFKYIKTDIHNNNTNDCLRNYTKLVRDIREGPYGTVNELSQIIQNTVLNFDFGFQELNDLDELNYLCHSAKKIMKYKIISIIDDLDILFGKLSNENTEESMSPSDHKEIERTLTIIKENAAQNNEDTSFWPIFITEVTAGAGIVGAVAFALIGN